MKKTPSIESIYSDSLRKINSRSDSDLENIDNITLMMLANNIDKVLKLYVSLARNEKSKSIGQLKNISRHAVAIRAMQLNKLKLDLWDKEYHLPKIKEQIEEESFQALADSSRYLVFNPDDRNTLSKIIENPYKEEFKGEQIKYFHRARHLLNNRNYGKFVSGILQFFDEKVIVPPEYLADMPILLNSESKESIQEDIEIGINIQKYFSQIPLWHDFTIGRNYVQINPYYSILSILEKKHRHIFRDICRNLLQTDYGINISQHKFLNDKILGSIDFEQNPKDKGEIYLAIENPLHGFLSTTWLLLNNYSTIDSHLTISKEISSNQNSVSSNKYFSLKNNLHFFLDKLYENEVKYDDHRVSLDYIARALKKDYSKEKSLSETISPLINNKISKLEEKKDTTIVEDPTYQTNIIKLLNAFQELLFNQDLSSHKNTIFSDEFKVKAQEFKNKKSLRNPKVFRTLNIYASSENKKADYFERTMKHSLSEIDHYFQKVEKIDSWMKHEWLNILDSVNKPHYNKMKIGFSDNRLDNFISDTLDCISIGGKFAKEGLNLSINPYAHFINIYLPNPNATQNYDSVVDKVSGRILTIEATLDDKEVLYVAGATGSTLEFAENWQIHAYNYLITFAKHNKDKLDGVFFDLNPQSSGYALNKFVHHCAIQNNYDKSKYNYRGNNIGLSKKARANFTLLSPEWQKIQLKRPDNLLGKFFLESIMEKPENRSPQSNPFFVRDSGYVSGIYVPIEALK